MKKNEICSIICSFNPDYERLLALCKTLCEFSNVYIVDNSLNLNKIFFDDYEVNIISPGENLGTLKAYNLIINKYPDYNYFWLWNQDTIISEESAKQFLEASQLQFLKYENVAATTIFDRKNRRHPFKSDVVLVKESTTLFKSNRIKKISNTWFDENLFMDYGDWCFSQTIIDGEGKIVEIKGIEYAHVLGEPESTVFGNLNRSSENRLYMQGLNSIYIYKKYGLLSFISLLLVARMFFIPLKNILFKKYFERTKAFYGGIIDGLNGKLSIEFIKNK